jgi:phage terminase large subunit-like protein
VGDRHGEDVVIQWPTNKIGRMFPALTRFLEDTAEGATTHDGDPTAKLHALAARKIAKPGDQYILGKPSENQKIDILMADVLATRPLPTPAPPAGITEPDYAAISY